MKTKKQCRRGIVLSALFIFRETEPEENSPSAALPGPGHQRPRSPAAPVVQIISGEDFEGQDGKEKAEEEAAEVRDIADGFIDAVVEGEDEHEDDLARGEGADPFAGEETGKDESADDGTDPDPKMAPEAPAERTSSSAV